MFEWSEMGCALAVGVCYVCGGTFSFNPMKVPSFRDGKGERQPVCETCMEIVNAKRKEKGLEPFKIHPDAYKAVDEEELVYDD